MLGALDEQDLRQPVVVAELFIEPKSETAGAVDRHHQRKVVFDHAILYGDFGVDPMDFVGLVSVQ